MQKVYWQIKNEEFVFPDYLENINSAPGRQIEEAVKYCNKELKIFLRGSLLENDKPFEGADADLFVVYNHSNQLYELRNLLPSNLFYDIKLIPNLEFMNDYVFDALLHCRSRQIFGDKLERKSIKADKKFAWEHWIKYCPAIIPDNINTSKNTSLIHFKLLTRCFGVLSFLKNKSFTRDISECITIACKEFPEGAEILSNMRYCLENKKDKSFSVYKIKVILMKKFDEYFNHWY